MDSEASINNYLVETHSLASRMPAAQIERAIEELFRAWMDQKAVYFMGNGGSASTASHFASDLSKVTAIPGKRRFKAVSLTENIPLITSWINDESFESIFVEQLRPILAERDVVVAISVHGASGSGAVHKWSQNLPPALQLARERHAVSIGLAGFDGGILAQLCDIPVIIPSNSLPHVEDFHLVLSHLMCFSLRNMIELFQE